jgi:hypothetical protein
MTSQKRELGREKMGIIIKKHVFSRGGATRRAGKTLMLASALFILVALSLSELTYAETFAETCEKIKDKLATSKNKDLKPFSEALAKFIKIRNDAGRVGISVDAGYNGDVSNTDNHQAISLDSSINKVVYPLEFRFKAGAQFYTTKAGQSQDLVSTFLVNLDFHIQPWLVTYGFVERFTDTFMSIKERYETGGGIELQWDILDPTNRKERDSSRDKDIENKSDIEHLIKDAIANMIEVLNKSKVSFKFEKALEDADIDAEELKDFIYSLENERKNLEVSLRKNRSKINLGLALTVMSEMEQADIAYDVIDTSTNQKIRSTDYLLPPTQRFRIVFRPSITYKVNKNLSLNSYVYFKEPLARPIYDNGRQDWGNGRRDWRYDGEFSAKYDFLKDTLWGGDVSVTLDYQRHYDKAPPYIPDLVSPGLTSAGQALSRTLADMRHEFVLIKIGVKF